MAAIPGPNPTSARIDHVRGLDALPSVREALRRFAPAVLMTGDGLGAIHAPEGDDLPSGAARTLWLLADARTLLDWESHRRQIVTLIFQSPDERIYLTLSGRTEVVAEPETVARVWRPAFKRWFAGGPADPRLLVVRFSTYDAEYFSASSGRVTAGLAH